MAFRLFFVIQLKYMKLYDCEGSCFMKFRYKIQILEDDQGNKTGVLLHVKDFEKLIESVENLQDMQTVFQRLHEKSIPYEKVRSEIFGNARKK
jgi:hypothetical protein